MGGAMKKKHSPRIINISWGHMEVEGVGTGKDFKLYPGGGREWDWGETHTKHVPGIQPADVQELLDRGSKMVVLSRGMQLMLRTCPETLQLLKDNGVGVYVEETRKAAELYNKLAEREPVGGLFHSTC
jgi:hypothetical protein